MHPNTSMGYSSNKAKAPPVVMDDCTVPVYGVAFGSSKGSAAAGTLSNTIVTASMLNWEKSKEEIPQIIESAAKPKTVDVKEGNSFYIDGQLMFVASRGASNLEEYYVVL